VSAFLKFSILLQIVASISAFSSAYASDVRILYVSSLPEIVRNNGKAGLAEVAAFVRAERDKNENVIFVHGGASLGPSVLGALDRGAHMMDILNLIEPDLMAVGKREFSYSEDQYTVHAQSSAFPFVASNMISKSTGKTIDATEADFIIELDELTVGFIALTSENVIRQYGTKNITMLPADTVVRQKSRELREQGADAIVLLADTDFKDLSIYTADKTVDAIFYADNDSNPFSVDASGSTLTKGALDGSLIVLTMKLAAEENLSAPISRVTTHAETVDLFSLPADPEVASLMQSYSSRLSILLKQEIGVVSSPFDTIRANIRKGESAFGNLVADAMRDAMGAEVAFLNGGGIRGDKRYAVGQIITREDIQLELPFNNTVVLFEVTGLQLLQALEYGLGCVENLDGCYLHVSNIEMTYDLSKAAGSRIVSAKVAGQPIRSAQTYRLSTLNFLANGGDGFEMLEGIPRLSQPGSGKLMWQVVAAYLQKQDKIEPMIEGRLTALNGDE